MAETSDAGKKRPRELFPEQKGAAADEAEDEAFGEPLEGDAAEVEAEYEPDEASKLKEEGGGAAKRRRSRTKRMDEGDWKELKPRHLRGKRRDEFVARQTANQEAATKRLKAGAPAEEEASAALMVQAELTRLLRPKARRWAMYEWFYSPVDMVWFRENPFLQLMQARSCPGSGPTRPPPSPHHRHRCTPAPAQPPRPCLTSRSCIAAAGSRHCPRHPPHARGVVLRSKSHRKASPAFRRLP